MRESINSPQNDTRVTNAKNTIDKMIASIREKISLKEDTIMDMTLRSGAIQLEDGTIVTYRDCIRNGKIQDSTASICNQDQTIHWEINGDTPRYQIFCTKYREQLDGSGEKQQQVESSLSQQFEGTTTFSIDNDKHIQLVQNAISGFETIGTTVYSQTPQSYSLFLNKKDRIEYKGEYDFYTIRRAIHDITGKGQMQDDNCIYSERRLKDWEQARKTIGLDTYEAKTDEEVQSLLQERTELLKQCNSLLEEAQQVVSRVVDKMKSKQSVSIKVRKAFGKLLGSKSLKELKKENPNVRVYLGASKNKEKFYEKFGFVRRIDADLGYGMILKE